VQVVAVGFESPEANAAWIADAKFPYEVWSDDTRALALHHGAATSADQVKATRLTFLLDDEGVVVLEYLDSQDFGAPPLRLLDDAESLWGSGD
jgi:peroxiredoxin